jgi:hypothetical protein
VRFIGFQVESGDHAYCAAACSRHAELPISPPSLQCIHVSSNLRHLHPVYCAAAVDDDADKDEDEGSDEEEDEEEEYDSEESGEEETDDES